MKTFVIYFRYWFIRSLYLLLLLFLVFGSYFYLVPKLDIGNYTIINPVYDSVDHLSPWLSDIDYFIFVFCIAIVILFSLIIFYDWYKKRKDRSTADFQSGYLGRLFDYLFMDDDLTENERKQRLKALKDTLNSDHIRRLFITTMISIHAQTEGVVKEKANKVMRAVKLKYLIYAYLRSPYIRHKLFALKAISEFRLDGFDKYILKLTKRKNDVLHAEAIVTLLNLKVYSNLMFLSDLKMKLTLWDINLIVKTIEELGKRDINYRFLINSVIPEVSALGLILTRLHNKTELKSEVLLKIGHSSDLVNEEAFFTLISFASSAQDFDFLIDKFGTASRKAKTLIIKYLDKYENTEKVIQFLNWVVQNKHFTLKIVAIKQLLDIDITEVSKFKHSDDLLIRQSCLQVLDINI